MGERMGELLNCWNCGKSLADVPLPISRHAHCASCFEVLHCCRMCLHYEPNKSPYCDDDRTDPPNMKENANFCEYFNPAGKLNGNDLKPSAATKSALDDLFDRGSKSATTDEAEGGRSKEDPVDRFKGLFDD